MKGLLSGADRGRRVVRLGSMGNYAGIGLLVIGASLFTVERTSALELGLDIR